MGRAAETPEPPRKKRLGLLCPPVLSLPRGPQGAEPSPACKPCLKGKPLCSPRPGALTNAVPQLLNWGRGSVIPQGGMGCMCGTQVGPRAPPGKVKAASTPACLHPGAAVHTAGISASGNLTPTQAPRSEQHRLHNPRASSALLAASRVLGRLHWTHHDVRSYFRAGRCSLSRLGRLRTAGTGRGAHAPLTWSSPLGLGPRDTG